MSNYTTSNPTSQQSSGTSGGASQGMSQGTSQGLGYSTSQGQSQTYGQGQTSSQQGTRITSGMLPVYNQLLGINQQHYGNVLGAYNTGQQNLSGNLPGVYQGYGQLGQGVASTLGMGGVLGQNGNWGVAAPAQQALQQAYSKAKADTTQGMTNAGLGNTTAVASAQNANTAGYGQALGSLGAQLAQTAAGYQSQIGLAGQGAQMQGLGQQTGLTQAALGPMGQQFGNTAGTLTGGYGTSAGYNWNRGQSAQQAQSVNQNQSQNMAQNMAQNQSQNQSSGGGGGGYSSPFGTGQLSDGTFQDQNVPQQGVGLGAGANNPVVGGNNLVTDQPNAGMPPIGAGAFGGGMPANYGNYIPGQNGVGQNYFPGGQGAQMGGGAGAFNGQGQVVGNAPWNPNAADQNAFALQQQAGLQGGFGF